MFGDRSNGLHKLENKRTFLQSKEGKSGSVPRSAHDGHNSEASSCENFVKLEAEAHANAKLAC